MLEVLPDTFPDFYAALQEEGRLLDEGDYYPNTTIVQDFGELIEPSFEGESMTNATNRLVRKLHELAPFYEQDQSNTREVLRGETRALNCLGRTSLAHAFYSENPDFYPTIGWTNIRGNHHFFNSVLDMPTGRVLILDSSLGAPYDEKSDQNYTFYGAVESFSRTENMTLSNKSIFGPLFERTMEVTRELFIDQLDTKMKQDFSLVTITETRDDAEMTRKIVAPAEEAPGIENATIVAGVELIILGDEESCRLVDSICEAKETQTAAA